MCYKNNFFSAHQTAWESIVTFVEFSLNFIVKYIGRYKLNRHKNCNNIFKEKLFL